MRAFGWLDAITGLLISSSLLHSFSKYYIEFNNFIYQDQVKILLLQVFDRIHLQGKTLCRMLCFGIDSFVYEFMEHFHLASFLWDNYLYSILLYVILNLVDQARLSKGYIHVLQFNGFFFFLLFK